jgi:aspartyl-tRNA(Asn)/glutamyl-tRNA(Gln) amidotransferase subunit A
MARTADDCGLILSVIAGYDPRDHDSLPAEISDFHYSDAHPTIKPMRIGKLTNAWPPNPALESQIDRALQTMERHGAKISDVQVPDGPFEDAAELTILMEAASSFRNLIRSGTCARLRDPLGQVNGYASEEFSSSDYLDVQRVRTLLQRKIDKLFDNYDVLAAAGSDTTAERLVAVKPDRPREEEAGATDKAANQKEPDGISSLCGLPAICVPCGFSSGNLPYGLQFMARSSHDQSVVGAARMYQSVTDWHQRRPQIS